MTRIGADQLRDAIRIFTENKTVRVQDVRVMMKCAFLAGASEAIASHSTFTAGVHLNWSELDAILFEEVVNDDA